MRTPKPMIGALFTIGYQGRTQAEYLALLHGAWLDAGEPVAAATS